MQKLLDSLRLPRLGAEDDHPLANPREAEAIFAELRGSDPLNALEEISDWLVSVVSAESLKPERRFEIIRSLDECAQLQRIKLARDPAGGGSQVRTQEAKLWTISHGLWMNAAAAYDDLIGRIEQKEKGSDALRKHIALIAVRALRAGGLRLKLLYVRYRPIPAGIWHSLARAYRLSETRGVQHARLAAYPGIPGDTSPEEEFLRTLLIAASAPDALTPPQLEIAERLIAGMASRFRITLQPNPDSTYWFDLASPRQPLRLASPPAQLTPGLRFFATAAGHADVQGLLLKLKRSNELPLGVDFGVNAEPQVVGEVLRHFQVNWAPQPPVRRSERRRLQGKISVAHGLASIVGLLRPSELDLDFDTPADFETWTVDNMSNGGFGAIVPQVTGDWLRIGALLAIRPLVDGAAWELAIVRRFSRDDGAPQGQANAGMQVLSRQPVHGVFTTNIGRWASGVATVDGVVVPAGGEPGAVLVALPHGLYLPGEQLLAMIAERPHLMFPVGLVERNLDYDLIKFRAMVQEV